jgi:hypothetical protein
MTAVVIIIRKVDFAAIRISSVAICVSSITGRNNATSVDAYASAVYNGACITAPAAVITVVLKIDALIIRPVGTFTFAARTIAYSSIALSTYAAMIAVTTIANIILKIFAYPVAATLAVGTSMAASPAVPGVSLIINTSCITAVLAYCRTVCGRSTGVTTVLVVVQKVNTLSVASF